MHNHTLPTRLDDGDQLYLRTLVEEQKIAQAALERFIRHLGQRYQLKATDAIDLDGTITRAPAVFPLLPEPERKAS